MSRPILFEIYQYYEFKYLFLDLDIEKMRRTLKIFRSQKAVASRCS